MTARILDGLREIEDLIQGYVDSVDGPDGQPAPNKAMQASMVIERLIAKAGEEESERAKIVERNRFLEEESAQRTVVIVGNPVDGISVVGPFADDELAADWGDRKGDGQWWLTHLAPIAADEETL